MMVGGSQQMINERGRNKERIWYSFRSPPGGRQKKTEAKEALDNWTNSITKVQHSLAFTYKINQFKMTQHHVPGLTTSTQEEEFMMEAIGTR
ncbi:unnamed protein product [Schistosoma margrebowiei]|uniref:Uncharacterized protein n=1 Tax=Schistosoma margrebowiei TaxID=48269 RepID=A0A183MWD1_9TREM|nr:unnamed protein product [Schistosoma margrebowiei]